MEFTILIPDQELDWFDSLDEDTINMALECYHEEIKAATRTPNEYLARIRGELGSSSWLQIPYKTERTIRLRRETAQWLTTTSREIDPENDNYAGDIAKGIILNALSRLAK